MKPHIQKFFTEKILNVESQSLHKIGQHFGCSMLSLNVHFEKDETLYLIAKIPPTNEFIRRFSNITFTFNNELNFYEKILPLLKQNQNVTTLDFLPKFFGGTPDSIILLENLKIQGYELMDRSLGFDLELSKTILKNLALLHGIGFNLKINNCKIFQQQIVPLMGEFKIRLLETGEDLHTNSTKIKICTEMLQNDIFCKAHMTAIEESFEKCINFLNLMKNSSNNSDTPWASIIHSDLWLNNLMFKDMDVKFIDFQNFQHASIAYDILYFLFLAVNNQVIKNHLDDLLTYYHFELTNILRKFQIDLQKFSFENFEKELRYVANHQALLDIIIFTAPLYSEDEYFVLSESAVKTIKHSKKGADRARLIVEEFVRKQWI